ncbi:Succinyl-CoA:(R)-benzylsuccinate CoA-transferase subunit BbsE [subsurface metagenome]
MGGAAGARGNRALMEWMDKEGMADDFLRNVDWKNLDMAKITQEFLDQLIERFSRFFMTHTSAELYEEAKERRIMLYPVNSSKDIAENPQLAARGFWEEVEHPELSATITYPGAFIKATQTPLSIRRRAPLIGEHNEEVYGELGISKKGLLTLKQGNII